jgi:hypothetical protein
LSVWSGCLTGLAEVLSCSANEVLDPGAEVSGALFIGADDEHGVVSGDGADDLRPVFVVDSGGDGLCAAGGGDDDDEIESLACFKAEAAQEVAQAGALLFAAAVGRGSDGVPGRPFIEIECVKVAGERGLGDMKTARGELLAQVILAGDGGMPKDVADAGVALLLHTLPFSLGAT